MSFAQRGQLISFLTSCLLVLNGCATQILLHPDTARKAEARRPVHPDSYGDFPEFITVTNQNQYRLTGWGFFSATNHGVVLVGDGNATGIAQTYEYNRYLLNHGFNILVVSYQGFDTNEGKADIHSLRGDLEAFYYFCLQRCPGQPISLMAESISTAPFFCFASRHPEITAVVLEAMVDPNSVAFAKVNDWWLFYPLYPLTFCAASLISAGVPESLNIQQALKSPSKVPALFIHHPQDKITPFRSARRVFDKYQGPKKWLTLEKKHSWERHMTGAYNVEIQKEIVAFLKANNISKNEPSGR